MKHRQRTAILLMALCATAGFVGCPPPNTFHSLTLNVSPPGSGLVLATPSQMTYSVGTEVTLDADPNPGWKFSYWEGGVVNTSVETTGIAMYQDESVTAYFVEGDDSDVISISTQPVLPEAVVDQDYEFTLTAVGGQAPYIWTTLEEGALPDGLLFTSGGTVLGTPLTAGTYTFEVRVTDDLQESIDRFFSLTVRESGTSDVVAILTDPILPDAEGDETYAFTLTAEGGRAPYLWTLTGSGALPPGLNLTNGGTVRGTPEIDGTYTFNVRATDADGETAEAAFSLTVLDDLDGNLTITSDLVLSRARVGQSYSFTFGATGGDSPYVWSVTDDQSLPAGLDFTSGGTLNGTPVVAGVYTLEVEVTDTDDNTESDFFTLDIQPRNEGDGLAITSDAVLPDAEAGVEYDFTFSASGGTPPYTWALAEGAVLPAGLALDGGGGLSGTPSSEGTFTFRVSVLDNDGEAADTFFAMTVQP